MASVNVLSVKGLACFLACSFKENTGMADCKSLPSSLRFVGFLRLWTRFYYTETP